MADFQFLQDPTNKNWVIMASRRAKRPQEEEGTANVCPFCPGGAGDKEEVDRFMSVRVLTNKYPFAPIHEVIIHSPDHHKNFDTLPVEQVVEIFKMYQKRYLLHQDNGQVYIFHNRGEMGGESLPHPHSQLVVVPSEVEMKIPKLPYVIPNSFRDSEIPKQVRNDNKQVQDDKLSTECFFVVCPEVSQWPDEVWIVPQKRNKTFGQITEVEITDLAIVSTRLIQLFDLRYKKEFPFNFYIYPRTDWYLRLIPRIKTLGGFELGTNIYVNTQDPKETMAFIKAHFAQSNLEKIAIEYEAEYERRV